MNLVADFSSLEILNAIQYIVKMCEDQRVSTNWTTRMTCTGTPDAGSLRKARLMS